MGVGVSGFMHVLGHGVDEGLWVCGTDADGVDDAENSVLMDVAGAVIAELATLEDTAILADTYYLDEQGGKALLCVRAQECLPHLRDNDGDCSQSREPHPFGAHDERRCGEGECCAEWFCVGSSVCVLPPSCEQLHRRFFLAWHESRVL